MKQEFITSRGKVILERDILYIRNLDGAFHHTLLYEIGPPILWLTVAVTKVATAETPFDFFFSAVFCILAIFHAGPLYDVVFRRSLSRRIHLNRITTYEVKDDAIGLETIVTLRLRNGRYKKIAFRTLERQYEAFTALLSPTHFQTQTA